MKEKSHDELYDRIKKLIHKKNNSSDDEYKEENIRDLAKESRINSVKEKRKAFINRLKEQSNSSNEIEKIKEAHMSVKESQGIERARYTKRYEGIGDILGITDSEIWRTKADFCEDQQNLIRHIVKMETVKMGIPRPMVIFTEMEDKEECLGFYNHDAKVIVINSSTKGNIKHNNLFEVIDTATHELRHSYQHYMLDSPERFPHINTLVKQYFIYEKSIYPDEKRQSTQAGFLEYLTNALEVDARCYAEECTLYYSDKTLSEIKYLEHVIGEPVHNQILLRLRDEVPSGNNPLMAVSNDFDFYKRVQSKVSQQNNAQSQKIEKKTIVKEEGLVNKMAVWSGATDLSEEAQRTAAKQYMIVVQNIQDNCEKMIRSFEQRIEDHPYKQLQHVANTFIELHNSDVPRAIKEAIQDWTRSDESFSKLLQDLDEDCSQESINAAERLQNSLSEQVDAYFTSMTEISIDKPVQVNEEVIHADQAFVNSWLKSLSDLKGTWKTSFEKFSQSNAIYANMISMVISTFNNVETVYEAAQTDITKVAEVYKEKRKTNVDRAIKKGEDNFSNIKDSRDIFQSLRKRKK